MYEIKNEIPIESRVTDMATAPELESAVPEHDLPDHKPAFLRRVQIRGYKSIAFCDVTLEPLTILVGRNASGKSNFVDALEFFKDMFETNLSDAILRHGGWQSILSKQTIDRIVSIDIDFEYLVGLDSITGSFSIAISQDAQLVPIY